MWSYLKKVTIHKTGPTVVKWNGLTICDITFLLTVGAVKKLLAWNKWVTNLMNGFLGKRVPISHCNIYICIHFLCFQGHFQCMCLKDYIPKTNLFHQFFASTNRKIMKKGKQRVSLCHQIPINI